MLTTFGKELRKLRINKGLLLKNMADDLGISSTYLSSIEHGRKNIPDGFVHQIKTQYGLSDLEERVLVKSYESSLDEIITNQHNKHNDKAIEYALARRFETLTDEKKRGIMKILMGKDGDDE